MEVGYPPRERKLWIPSMDMKGGDRREAINIIEMMKDENLGVMRLYRSLIIECSHFMNELQVAVISYSSAYFHIWTSLSLN